MLVSSVMRDSSDLDFLQAERTAERFTDAVRVWSIIQFLLYSTVVSGCIEAETVRHDKL